MGRIHFLLAICLLLPAATVLAHPKAGRPNFLIITADDMNWDSVGCYGCPLNDITPSIDKLATEGMMFSDAYAGCSVCAPARSCLMTGMHMGHTSVRSSESQQS